MGLLAGRRTGILGGLVAVIYTAWAVPFMLESAVTAIDGRRYYNLFDDAMISMRYAWNFSHGLGLVWNPGQRVEGYTNLLQTLIMSIFAGVLDKSSAVLGVQALGILMVLGCAYLVWRLSRALALDPEPVGRPLFTAAIVLLTLTYFPLSYWSLTGMETGLLTILVLGSLHLIERFRREGREQDFFLAAGLLGLACVNRLDALIFAIPLLAYAADCALRQRRTEPSSHGHRQAPVTLLMGLGLFLAFPVGQELFRLQYYGALLPNTYYLKVAGFPLAERIRNGLGFLSLYFWTHAVFLAVGIVAFGLAPDRRKGIYLLVVVAPILYEIWAGGDPARVWRMMAPAEPIAAILFVMGGNELLRRLGISIPTRAGTAAFGVLTAAGILTINSIFFPMITLQQTWFPADFYAPRVNAAVALNEVTTVNATVGVLAAGVVPYYTGRVAYDYLGRSDTYVASREPDLTGAVAWNGMNSVPGHNKYDLTYSIQQLGPTYTDTNFWGQQDLRAWVAANYTWVDYRGIGMYLKSGSPDVRWGLVSP